MNYREITALLREAESRDNLAASLKGGKAAKEFREERLALEKAAGGAKKLAEAEKVFAEANDEAAKIIVKAQTEAGERLLVADDVFKTEKVFLDFEKRQLDKQKGDLETQKEGLRVKTQELKDALVDIKGREKAADERDIKLDRREVALTTRDANVSAREAKAKRHDEWEAQRPA